MKVLILLGLVAAAYANIGVNEPAIDPTYSIIEQRLIPYGEKLRKAEEHLGNERIIGGSPAILGQFPYQVATLASYQGITGTGVCGGSIVSPNRVIYAAHCWFDGVNTAWRVTVVAGSLTAFTGGVRLDTSSVALHPQWFPALIRNDVAVIYLPSSLTITANIAPVALPSDNQVNQNFAGRIGVASGYGITSDGGSLASSLQHVPLNIISNLVCSFSFPLIVAESNLCTSSATGSTCSGDSGGPLTVTSGGQTILVGITSFGSAAGCESGSPAVFARVTSFLGFFNQHL